jgi:hypothetical protein
MVFAHVAHADDADADVGHVSDGFAMCGNNAGRR